MRVPIPHHVCTCHRGSHPYTMWLNPGKEAGQGLSRSTCRPTLPRPGMCLAGPKVMEMCGGMACAPL